jgi:hypothetical protein
MMINCKTARFNRAGSGRHGSLSFCPHSFSKAILVLLFLAALCSCSGTSSRGDEEALVAEFEGGRLYRVGAVPVVQLHGTHYQMGRQYGMLLREDLNAAYRMTIDTFSPYLTYERMKQVAENVYGRYPQRYKDIIIGMSETSGLGLERQLVLNAMELLTKINTAVPHCSGFGVWGDFTRDGNLIFGRNNDDAALFRNFSRYVVVAVFNAVDSGIPVAIVNYAGVIYAPTAMNRAGIFMELNSGNPLGYAADNPLIVTEMFSLLESCSTQEEVEAAFRTVSTDLSSIVNVADPTIAYSFEYPMTAVKRRPPDEDGLLASTNHFVDPSWGMPAPQPDSANGWSVKRRDNLLTFARANKGTLDLEKMKYVLDTQTAEGGVFEEKGTIFQVIAFPKEATLWLRVPTYLEWQKINLARMFY